MGVFNFPNFLLRTNPVLPTSFDDTLSYYEALGKTVTYLNQMSEGMNALANALVSPYDSNVHYTPGMYCWNNDKLYKCVDPNWGTWDLSDWEEAVFVDEIADDFLTLNTEVTEELTTYRDILNCTIANFAEPYSNQKTYSVGDYVSYIDNIITDEIYEYNVHSVYTVGMYCRYQGVVYLCIANTIGVFDPTKWVRVNALYKCTTAVDTPENFDTNKWEGILLVKGLKDYVDELWETFVNRYNRTWGIVNETGTSTTDAMSQNATTIELLKRLTNMGTLESGRTIASITDSNSIYALVQDNDYDDYPDSTAPNGFVITIHNVSMWAQLFISYTTTTGGTNSMGRMWYRSGANRNYNDWVRVNTKKSELDALAPLNSTGSSTTRAMSQYTTTQELLKRLTNMGTLASGSIADITDDNSIYGLIQSNSYSDYPDSTAPNGFVITVHNVTMWAQLFISYTTTNGGTANTGKMWYRSGLNRNYNPWVRVNQNAYEINQINTALGNCLKGMSTLPAGLLSEITAGNSIYGLVQSNAYADYPDPDIKNGFIITLNNVSMWAQLVITYTTATGGTTHMGRMWYRSGASRNYNDWVKLNQDPEDIAKNVKNVDYPGTATTPTSITAPVNGNRFYTSYLLPTWVSETLNNISDSDALSEITFGGNNRAFIGVQRNALRLIVGNAQSSNDVVKNATVKLTSYPHKIAMFGDSITWGRDSGESGVVATQHTFAKTIARNLGVPVYNYGVGSQGWLAAAGTPNYTAYEKIANTNISTFTDFILAWGVNDFSTAHANDWALLGAYNTTDETTLIGQMYKSVNYIYTQRPNANVIIVAPWFIKLTGTSFPLWGYSLSNLAYMANRMEEFCSYYGLPFISMKQSPLNGWTVQNWLLDNVHPNTEGYKVIGQWFAGEISKIIG